MQYNFVESSIKADADGRRWGWCLNRSAWCIMPQEPAHSDQADGLRALIGSKIEEFPTMMKFHTERSIIQRRSGDLDEVINPWIDTASLFELKQLIERMIEREATLTGCATELEDAACALATKIEQEAS